MNAPVKTTLYFLPRFMIRIAQVFLRIFSMIFMVIAFLCGLVFGTFVLISPFVLMFGLIGLSVNTSSFGGGGGPGLGNVGSDILNITYLFFGSGILTWICYTLSNKCNDALNHLEAVRDGMQ